MTPMARFTMPETLPEGEEKVEAVRSMFDAIAPRYDLVNRIMTFRMDVGLASQDGARASGCRRRPPSSTWRAAPATCAASWRRAASDRSGWTCRSGCWRPPAPTRRSCTATPSGCRCPTDRSTGVTCGFALRNFASLPPFFAELARVVRPGGRIALLEVAEPPNRLLRAGHGFYFGKVVPLVGGLLSDPAAYRYLPRSVAYLPEPTAMLEQLRGGRVRRTSTAGSCRSASPS